MVGLWFMGLGLGLYLFNSPDSVLILAISLVLFAVVCVLICLMVRYKRMALEGRETEYRLYLGWVSNLSLDNVISVKIASLTTEGGEK